jgi:biopolymer transport protein ExbD
MVLPPWLQEAPAPGVRWPGVELPAGSATAFVGNEVTVVVTPGHVSVDGEEVADLNAKLANLAVRLRSIAERNPQAPFDGELLLVADRRMPFAEVMNVVTSAHASSFVAVRLVVAGPGGTPGRIALARHAAAAPTVPAAPELTVIVRADGVSVRASGGALPPGCVDVATVEGLGPCLALVGASLGGETNVTVEAGGDRAWGDVVRVVDAAAPQLRNVRLARESGPP